ncbi:hypothetical protein J5226_19370 [Lysobacter sp. K5869]|uniref:hypothetical protein n=1 Tax=Lysobacter sp. K5869 TaxID=2820808 RepID=UPI001C062A39|nr:hypothetical protein [Lysobacter sp. K5869]QWP75747.1 hypothetical protein J5226_19370 [Lysobacter sp. K5869]
MNANASLLGLSLAAGLLGALCATPARAATAQNINLQGSACRNYNASEALDIDYLTSGARNINASARSVICPVARHPVTGPGQNFFVDGSNTSGSPVYCGLYAYDYNGTLLSSTSTTLPGYASLPTVSYWGYVSVLCTLPGGGAAVVYGASAIDN